jgi:hypothetical protein
LAKINIAVIIKWRGKRKFFDSNFLRSRTASVTGTVAVVVLIDISSRSRLWGFWHFLFCRFALKREAGITFVKVLGSGENAGFGLRPSPSHQGLFCAFVDDAAATNFIAHSKVVNAYREHAREFFCVKLKAFSSRGSWASESPLSISSSPPHNSRIAALTRASIRLSVAAKFWRRAPPAELSLQNASGCLLAVGLGEAPLLRQATFTIWESVAAMDAYARTGAHLEAIRAAHAGDFFSESMFTRFIPYDARGVWKSQPAELIVPTKSSSEVNLAHA